MKKIIGLIIFFWLIFLIPFVAFAWETEGDIAGIDIKSYVVSNTSAVTTKVTNLSTSTFPLTNKIIGYEVVATAATATYGSLFDVASGDGTSSNVITEVMCSASFFNYIWFPYPKEINTALTVVQGVTSDVIIFYVE